MALNRELFKKIHDVISVEPDKFRMSDWEDSRHILDFEGVTPVCGTTRCIAGWAINLTTDAPIYLNGEHSPETIALAREKGARVTEDDDCESVDLEELGGILLGLDNSQRGIFYSGDQTAARFVAAVAQGDETFALEILRDRHK